MDAVTDDPADPPPTDSSPPPESPGRDRPAHSIRPRTRPALVAAVAGLAATLTAVGIGTAALVRVPAPTPPAQQTLRQITVAPVIPLSEAEILALLARDPDYGQLDDPHRLAACLRGLDYPASTRVLGARPIQLDGKPAELLVVPGDRADTVIALAVATNCSAVDTGLLADTTVTRR
ncbi:hypothetical protein [Mycobacterium talmoniae]|uniref:Anti-sigma-M factor RsmA n=1 Tax=Mycobacterium talmoniae TaxID=1858794 RepID=A0A1S1NET5_9MYCO|nr:MULTISPECIES: hypothetical protein [Mycobacterium]OHU98851.1 hypothetical protein BKN37_20005 [Mycobacterium talmoniae]